jgi:replicative DNA helicase
LEDKQTEKKKKTPEEIAEEHQAILDYAGPDRIVPASEVQQRVSSQGVKIPIAKMGIDLFDKVIKGGVYPGQLIVVSGKTGEGKTTFCRTLTDSFAKQGACPLWFSYEEVEEEFLEKFPANILNYFYMPNELTDKSVEWVNGRIKQGRLKWGCRVVFIDHLHYLVDLYRMKNASLEIGAVMRSLKRIALANRIALCLVAHIGKVESNRELQAGDIRDSSFIEQESDLVFMGWRETDTGRTIIKLTKNRKGGHVNIKVKLTYNEALGIYDYGKEA